MNRKKKAAAMGLATIMAVSAVGGVALAETRTTYTDVANTAWYYSAVDTVTNDLKLMQGEGAGRFNPEGSLTREQFVQVLYNMSSEESKGYGDKTSKFTDVDPAAWYAPALAWAEENNVTNGTSDTTFGIGEFVTREQMAQFMCNYCEQNGLNPVGDKVIDSFNDADTASDWAKDAVEWSRTAGLFQGDNDGNFKPTANITRAEAAQVMANFYGNAHEYVSLSTTATCTEYGEETFLCVICGKIKTEIDSPLGHWSEDEGVVTKEATCTEDGERTLTCAICGETYTKVIPAAHSWDEGVVTKEASCTEIGEKTFTCTVCGETKTEVIPSGHSWDEGVVTKDTTCTEDGEITYTCTICGDTKTQIVTTGGHNWELTKTIVGPTDETETGRLRIRTTKYYTCTICGEEMHQVSIPTEDELNQSMFKNFSDYI